MTASRDDEAKGGDHTSPATGLADREATFTVGVRIGTIGGQGKLIITPGSIVLETGRLTRSLSRVARVVDTGPQVTLVSARLVPPWFNTSLTLHDHDVSCYATTWQGARPRLRASLRAAGFDVVEVSTWFSLAGDRHAASLASGRGARELRSRLGPAGLIVLVVATIIGALTAVLVVSHSPGLPNSDTTLMPATPGFPLQGQARS
jgi:hypothetical protein